MARQDVVITTPCEINTKKAAIACTVNCLSTDQVASIKLYLLVHILMALVPGTYGDFTLDDWKDLLKEWQALSESEREASDLGNIGVFAEAVGVTLSSDINDAMEAAKCYFCIDAETRLNLIAAIECLLWQVLAGQQNQN